MNPDIIPFTPGQRWISQVEPELGIGILTSFDKRTVDIRFPAADTSRRYSRGAAPLKRVIFKVGDRVETQSGDRFRVEALTEADGLIRYQAGSVEITEEDLAATMGFSLPQERLLAGMAGTPKEFRLRKDILFRRAAYEQSGVRGFLGGQIDLIPHQFYIAGEITQRHIPRVLLSDETGLGKTIEACLILHHLLVTHRISRVLIIVPDALVHQWFVELYRKFNLSFQIFDAELCQARGASNPFLDAQLGLISQDVIQRLPGCRPKILESGWDMVVMDEAHHIVDTPDFYAFMKKLGCRTSGLILLSATPEQMGIDTFFSQLNLLDPDRYFDLDAYKKEDQGFRETAEKVEACLRAGKDPQTLLDTYGPGRVIFRNKRERIQGFPGRTAHLIPLDADATCVAQANRGIDTPETELNNDPRIQCLAALLKQVKPEKILVICRSRETVAAVDGALQEKISVDAARFDETMTLMQRDRAAAWFSREDGARLLICSEIGSEGRNFQFVRHLFLFDLPLVPELLEQRIGRVDRIGQQRDIHIHVPYIRASAQEVLARWYGNGLGLFAAHVNGTHTIFRTFAPRLTGLIRTAAGTETFPEADLATLINDTARYCRALQKELARGKDILLERNSFKPDTARALLDGIGEADRDGRLEDLLSRLFDCYGIDLEPVGGHLLRLERNRPVDDTFPALPGNAEVITLDRETAVAREDLPFFSWDHPYVSQVTEFFLTQGEGACAVARAPENAPAGLFLMTVFVLECVAPTALNMERFLPLSPIRTLVDHDGTPVDPAPWTARLKPDRADWFLDHDRIKNDLLPDLLDRCRNLAEKQAESLLASASQRIRQTLARESDRLLALQKINTDIRDAEIQSVRNEMTSLLDALDRSELRLDSLCLIRSEP